ncbi:hypothetical protein LZG04_28975 [Saccharothrix sp. S26]|uniref:hypothetical protein n=1 Tax=Saccharothrix sp. S26 TaxID=2907215 RepID=UPI001F176D2B|nr:hypothetical protein [Saccharothrix sp. S26]MCE6998801.1 hypothetical protein [Saccharothrix sp. S26]
MRLALTAAVLGLSAGVLSGCGGDGGGQDASQATTITATTTTAATSEASAKPEAKGLDGTWKPINDSPIATLTVTGTTAQTTGELACPGTITDADSAKPVLTLDCPTPNEDRKRGTLELKPDGSALVVTWDGPAWGGLIDSLKRAD